MTLMDEVCTLEATNWAPEVVQWLEDDGVLVLREPHGYVDAPRVMIDCALAPLVLLLRLQGSRMVRRPLPAPATVFLVRAASQRYAPRPLVEALRFQAWTRPRYRDAAQQQGSDDQRRLCTEALLCEYERYEEYIAARNSLLRLPVQGG